MQSRVQAGESSSNVSSKRERPYVLLEEMLNVSPRDLTQSSSTNQQPSLRRQRAMLRFFDASFDHNMRKGGLPARLVVTHVNAYCSYIEATLIPADRSSNLSICRS